MIGIAVLTAIFMVLAIVLYRWTKRRQVMERTQKSLFEAELPTPTTPEDKLVLRLLDKIKAPSTQLYFSTFESRQVFSDGHLLEFADHLPPAIEKLRYLYTQNLPEDEIRRIIPSDVDGLSEKVQALRELGGKYELSSKTHRCIVDGLYYDYLRMRYPKAEVFCRGKTRPVTFSQEGIVRAVLMPIKG